MKRIIKFWKKLGPGLVTGASDDDPSGIATYSQAGASFGLLTLWTALVTYPLMFSIQEMCARIGIVTGAGLGHVIKVYYSKLLVWLTLLALFPAITFNIAADLAGMGAVAHLLWPIFPIWLYALFFTVVVIFGLILFSYRKMTAVLKWLSISLLVYAIVPFLVKQDWAAVFWAVFLPKFEWSKEFWTLLVAILGTTISPYLFLWQTSMSIEEKNHKDNVHPTKEIKDMRMDVNIGMFWSNLIMFFILLTAGSVLFPSGNTHIDTVQAAAEALNPLAGEFAYEIFALGVIGTGFLAIPVLAGCLGYLFADVFQWEKGMDKKCKEAKGFYSIIVVSIVLGLAMNIFEIDPIASLIYTAVIYGILAPFLIAIILHICNQKKIMKNYTNHWLSNLLGLLAFLLMGGSAVLLIYLSIS